MQLVIESLATHRYRKIDPNAGPPFHPTRFSSYIWISKHCFGMRGCLLVKKYKVKYDSRIKQKNKIK